MDDEVLGLQVHQRPRKSSEEAPRAKREGAEEMIGCLFEMIGMLIELCLNVVATVFELFFNLIALVFELIGNIISTVFGGY